MKRESNSHTNHTPAPKDTWGLENEQSDPQDEQLWNLLGQASKPEPGAFFARNVVRQARLQDNNKPASTSRLRSLFDSGLASSFTGFFSPTKLAMGAAACVCALTIYQMWPASVAPAQQQTQVAITPVDSVTPASATSSSALTELIIVESLNAAAEDPTIFTHDELIAMIGF